MSGCHKRHMQLFCPKEPQRQPRYCSPHSTDLKQSDKKALFRPQVGQAS